MVSVGPGNDFAQRATISGAPAQALAARRQVDQARAALVQWEAEQQAALEQKRQALDIRRQQWAQTIAQAEDQVERGTRMATNPYSGQYAHGGVVPHYAQGGTTAQIVGYAPNGVAVWQGTDGMYYYVDQATNSLMPVPPQLLAQLSTTAPQWGTPAAPPASTNMSAPTSARLPGAASTINQRLPKSSTQTGVQGGGTTGGIGAGAGNAMAQMAGAEQQAVPPMPGGLVAPTPDQWSPEFRAAVAAREAAQAQAQREQQGALGFADFRGREGPAFAGRSYAHGGMHGDMQSGPPMPPEMAEGMGGQQGSPAITGEGMDHDGTMGGEVVLVPEGQGLYRAHYVEGPTKSNLPGGTLIVPLPPHLDETFRGELPPLPGEPAPEYAMGGMTPPMGLPPLPPVYPWAGVQQPNLGNLQTMSGASQMSLLRANQGLIAGGQFEGVEGARRRLLNTAPGTSSFGTYSG